MYLGADILFDVQASSAPVAAGIDWARIGTNVLASLGTGLSTVGLSALQNAIAPHLATAQQAVAAATAAAPRPQTPAAIQQSASWQKYLPYAIGGAVLLGGVYMFTQRKRG
jgi:hypothetical protein